MNEELDRIFNDLQSDMEQKASIYKDTKFDPFYRFCIGEMNWKECVEKIAKEFNGS